MAQIFLLPVALLIVVTCASHISGLKCTGHPICTCRRNISRINDTDVIKDFVDCRGQFETHRVDLSTFSNRTIYSFSLSHLNFPSLKRNLFSGINIENLNIKNSNGDIHPSILLPIRASLRHLSLVYCNVDRTWNLSFLQDFVDLESLTLDKNGVYPANFPARVFKNLNLQSLSYLSLKTCGIAKVSDYAFEGLPSLEVLDLSYNNFSVIPEALLYLRNLREINLSHNLGLTYVRDHAFGTLGSLRSIDFSHTGIDIISSRAFTGLEESLEILKLDHAKLLNGHFESMKGLIVLKSLDLSYNMIFDMHNRSLEGFVSLEELDISGQYDNKDGYILRISFIDSMFRGVENKLRVLKLRDLGLISLPLGSIASLKNLEVLDASGNDFTEIDEGFFEDVHARTIYLNDMPISEVSSKAFADFPQGMNIYLDRNNITNISFVLNTKRCLFDTLSLEDNPVRCGCDVVEIAATDRVKQFLGTCADNLYRDTELRRLQTIELAQKECKSERFKKIVKCDISSLGYSSGFHLNTSLLYLLSLLWASALYI